MLKNILIYSGGLDSTTLLWELKPDVTCLSFDYGQRHVREIDRALEICKIAKVDWRLVELEQLRFLLNAGSQTGLANVPTGHYAEESMKTTIVPNRNMIMISIAVGHAIAIGAKSVYYAAHAGDHAIYPDCRPEYVQALAHAVRLGNAWSPIDVIAPYLRLTKAEIVKKALDLKVPLELTWSCYQGNHKPCGKCGTCVERLEAFDINNATDPLDYVDRDWWRTLAKV